MVDWPWIVSYRGGGDFALGHEGGRNFEASFPIAVTF